MDWIMTRVQECLAYNMKRYRKLKGMTQEELAEKAGTSTNYIGTIETGKKFPSPQMIEKIAQALELDSPLLFQSEAAAPVLMIQKKFDVRPLKSALCKQLEAAIEDYFKQ